MTPPDNRDEPVAPVDYGESRDTLLRLNCHDFATPAAQIMNTPTRSFPSDRPRGPASWLALYVGQPNATSSVVLATWLAALFIVATISLPLPQIGFAQDLGVMLDAGWRYYQGQRTHADYHSPLGPLFAIIFGLPMKLGGPTYSSMKLLPAVVTAVFTAWTVVVCSTTVHPWPRACLAAAIGAASGGLFHLGFPVEALSFAVFYNRVGFGLLCIIGLSSLLPRATDGLPRAVPSIRDTSIAVASGMCFFLKVNFFIAALPFWLATTLLHRRTRRDYAWFAVALVGTCAFFLNEIGFRLDRMLFDLSMAADARRACLDSFFFPLRNAVANHDFAIILALLTVGMYPVLRADDASIRTTCLRLGCVWGPALLGYSLTLMQSHGDGRGIPLVLVSLATGLAWSIEALRRCEKSSGASESLPSVRALKHGSTAITVGNACLVCGAALFIIPHAYSYYFLLQVSRAAGSRQFQATAVRDLYIGPFANNLEPNAVPKMNEALQLLSRHMPPGASLQYMDMNNIYTFASQSRSPARSMLFWDNRSSYTAARHPPAADFSDSDFLLMPKPQLTQAPLETEWWSIYAIAIEDNYDVAEETTFFKLWRRSQDSAKMR